MRTSSIFGPLALAIGTAAGIACGAPQQPAAPAMNPDSIRAGVMATIGQFNPAMLHKDAAGLASMYADDATWILPDGSVYKGRAAIQAGATAFFKTFDSATAQPATVNAFFPVDSTNAVVFAQVPYTIYVKGKPSSHINYFATHFVKSSDGHWLVHHDYNIDAVIKDTTARHK